MSEQTEVKGRAQGIWASREEEVMNRLGLKNQAVVSGIQQMVQRGVVSLNHFYLPAGLRIEGLIGLAGKVGIKINNSPHCNGQKFPTKAGLIGCDLSAIMTASNPAHHPFFLNYEEQEAWTRSQGGCGLTSVEETIYLLIRHRLEFGRVLFMGGWIRCCNCYAHSSDSSLGVTFDCCSGLHVVPDNRSMRGWSCGAIAREFIPLAATP